MTMTDEEFKQQSERLDEALANLRPMMARWLTEEKKFTKPPHSSNATHLDSELVDLNWEVSFYTDGTVTEAIISDPTSKGEDQYLAHGVARRRKGETRDFEVGKYLALSRALAELSSDYLKTAEERLR